MPDVSNRKLFKLVHPLWTPNPTTPTPDSHLVDLGFHFTLPREMPPSVSEGDRTESKSPGLGLSIRIEYKLVVVAERQGVLRRARQIGHIVTILRGSDSRAIHLKSLPASFLWSGVWPSPALHWISLTYRST
jgi:hypothetical protein